MAFGKNRKSKKAIFGPAARDEGGKSLSLSRKQSETEAWAAAIMPAEADSAQAESDTNRRPLVVFGVVTGALLVGLVLRLGGLQLIDGSRNLAIADGNRIREVQTRAPRGLIYDSQGNIVARNQPAYDIVVIPARLPQDKTARTTVYTKVGALLGVTEAQIKTKAEPGCTSDSGCLSSYQTQLVVSSVSRDQALLFDQDSSALPGFSLDVNPIRQYDDVQHLFAPFLGYTGRINADELTKNPSYQPTDLIGKGGLESSYESVLRGTNGDEQSEVDATGKPIKVLSSTAAVPGKNIVLSLDQGLQAKMASAIQEQLKASGATRAAGVAINPKTGAVLAAVSLPTYDNNSFAQGISQAEYTKLTNDPGQPLFNKVTSGTYPSGSIIKPLAASAALQEGVITTQTIINDTAYIEIPNQYDPSKPGARYHSWETKTGLGLMNVFSALAQSSDIFFYEVAGGFTNFTNFLGVDRLTHYYTLFGLGTRTGIDLPYESAGRVPTPAWKKTYSGEDWYTGDTYNIGVGQGDLLVTPLQMAMAIGAVANGGTLYQPHLVDRITDATGKTVKPIEPVITKNNFISPANLTIVRQGMLDATQSPKGTACCRIKAEVPVAVGAKTGSAETDTSGAPQIESWFVSFAPYNDPNIVTVVFLEKAGEGAQYAAPATREILKYYFTEGAGAVKK